MSITSLGTYVLYQGPDADAVLAIVFPDDDAPHDFQRERPSGYVTLVLLVDEPHQFRWARTSQLSPVPGDESRSQTLSKEQEHARAMVVFWKEARADLQYWRKIIKGRNKTWKPPSEHANPDSDEEIDSDLKEALRISKEDYYGSACSDSNPAFSQHIQRQRGTVSDVIVVGSDDEENDDDLDSRPPRQRFRSSPKRARPSTICDDPDMISPSRIGDKRTCRRQARSASPSDTPKRGMRTQFSGITSFDQLLGTSRLNQRASAPASDAIDGDIGESKEYVQFVVGADSEIRRLPRRAVWDRLYFRDSNAGRNYFRQNEEGIWELRHPELASITIDDFQFIAEYMEVDDFGIRVPDTPEETKEAIAQCVAAWEAAEKLGMDDLLDHIANKVKFLEWDNEDMLIMAIIVYRSDGPVLHAHSLMREWAAEALAHHFWTYMRDENIGPLFRKRLRKLPELERDVFMIRGALMEEGVDMLEDQESDEDEDEPARDENLM